MTTTPNAIFIQSSSPEHIWARSISPCTPERLFGFPLRGSSPPSMLSPSRLFGTPSPSRQYDASKRGKSPLGEELGRENLSIGSSRKKKSISGKGERASRQGKTKQQNPTNETERFSKESRSQTAKKPAETTKRARTQITKWVSETGNKVLKGRVSKSGSGKSKDSAKEIAISETTEQQVSTNTAKKNESLEHDCLQLEEAVVRRLDWTPPKNTECQVIGLDDDTPKETEGGREFGSLLLNYRLSESDTSQDIVQKAIDGHPTKRRRIELVDYQVLSKEPRKLNRQTKPSQETLASDLVDETTLVQFHHTKAKLQKKKIRTITGLATAQYMRTEEEKDTTLQQYLQKDDNQAIDNKAKAGKRKTSRKKRKNGAVKPDAPDFVILSPEAAAKSLTDQELLFGTCSQLERDDSPTFLRETQMTLLESESSGSVEQSSMLSGQSSTLTSRSVVSRFTSSRRLWSVAARDSDGFVVQPEFLDMVDSPNAHVRQNAPQQNILETSFDQQEPSDVQSDLVSRSNMRNETVSKRLEQQPLCEKKRVAFESAKSVENRQAVAAAKESSDPPLEMPRYSGFTDAELSKQITAYGFKSVKGRIRMITLLEKCWQNMHPNQSKEKQKAQPGTTTEPSSQTVVAALQNTSLERSEKQQPRRQARGRPKKDQSIAPKSSAAVRTKSSEAPKQTTALSSSTKILVEEIEDSEEEIIPSPTRIQQQQNQYLTSHRHLHRSTTPTSSASSTLPLSLRPAPSPSKRSNRPCSSMTQNGQNEDKTLPDLSTKITEAIRAQPRMPPIPSDKGPPKLRLTWHEKILLYDPIVLEDLATWLNTEGLGLVGEDHEVSAWFLRKWCESKGICCCYKKKQ